MTRISADGPDADVFIRNFMTSFNRTRLNGRWVRPDTACMDGVFFPTLRKPAMRLRREALCARRGSKILPLPPGIPENLTFRAKMVDGAIEFASIWEPNHEQVQLTAISNAYPNLTLTYDYAEKDENIFGRYKLHNGAVVSASEEEMAAVKNEPGFKQLVAKSGWTD